VNFYKIEEIDVHWNTLPFWSGSVPELKRLNGSVEGEGGLMTENIAAKIYSAFCEDFISFGYDKNSWKSTIGS
jgi:hypothetical protein